MIIVYVFEKWWSELKDIVFLIDMITDHKNLKYFIIIKKLSCCQAHWSKFLFCFNFKIVYCFRKASDKFDALTHQSENLSKERNNSDECHLHQNQTVLKKHNLDKAVIQDFQNNVAAQKLNQEVVSTLAHEIESTAVSTHCQSMRSVPLRDFSAICPGWPYGTRGSWSTWFDPYWII